MAAFHILIESAGFEDVRFSEQRYDIFSDAPLESSAEAFGTLGINVWAVKPDDPDKKRPSTLEASEGTEESTGPVALDALPPADDLYDAGSLGCADGPVMEISRRLKAMDAGAVLEIRSTDPSVAGELPSWCRMTGHTYLGQGSGADQGRYFVRRRDD